MGKFFWWHYLGLVLFYAGNTPDGGDVITGFVQHVGKFLDCASGRDDIIENNNFFCSGLGWFNGKAASDVLLSFFAVQAGLWSRVFCAVGTDVGQASKSVILAPTNDFFSLIESSTYQS